ncbi:MAG: SMC-Scp complex subunit ScpB [Syntrophaceae bacterium]
MEDLRAIIEAMIFSSETPLSVNKMKDALGDVAEKSDILREIEEIKEEHFNRAGGFTLEEIAGGYQFRTRADLASWVRKIRGIKPGSLSPAAMETLAVIAYRQPVLKADIERVRGVDVSGPLKGLMEKKLIKMLGRKDVPGRPMMYGTSREFLESFNLKDLSELPTLRELKELQDEMGETGDIFEASESEAVRSEATLGEAGESENDQGGPDQGEAMYDEADPGEAIPGETAGSEAGQSQSGRNEAGGSETAGMVEGPEKAGESGE